MFVLHPHQSSCHIVSSSSFMADLEYLWHSPSRVSALLLSYITSSPYFSSSVVVFSFSFLPLTYSFAYVMIISLPTMFILSPSANPTSLSLVYLSNSFPLPIILLISFLVGSSPAVIAIKLFIVKFSLILISFCPSLFSTVSVSYFPIIFLFSDSYLSVVPV